MFPVITEIKIPKPRVCTSHFLVVCEICLCAHFLMKTVILALFYLIPYGKHGRKQRRQAVNRGMSATVCGKFSYYSLLKSSKNVCVVGSLFLTRPNLFVFQLSVASQRETITDGYYFNLHCRRDVYYYTALPNWEINARNGKM